MSLSRAVFMGVAGLAFILACEASVQDMLRRNQAILKTVNGDQGNVTDCGDHKTMSTFSFNWSPKYVKFGDTLTINADFNSAIPFTSGQVCYTVWVNAIPDPLINTCQAVTCEDLLNALGKIGFKIKCPLAKGASYQLKDYKLKLLPMFPIPPGSYTVSANVTTTSSAPYMCAKGGVTIKG